MKIVRFETGNIYWMQFVGDADLRPQYICIHRTAKFATFQKFQGGETIRRKIEVFRGRERISYASYSMAPSIWADHVAG